MNEYQSPYQAPRKDKSRTTLIVVIVLVCVLVPCLCVVGVFGFGFYLAKNTVIPMTGCLITMTEARDSIIKYADAHGGKLPDAKTWQDDVKKYYSLSGESADMAKKFGVKRADEEWTCRPGDDGVETGIAYNSDLSGKRLADVKTAYAMIVLFEIPKAQHNASQPYKALPIEQSPRMMGQHAGWFYIMLEGDAVPPNGTGQNSRRRWSRSRSSTAP